MKKIPDLNVNADLFTELQLGQIKSQLLMTAIELKVFNYTVKPLTSAEVAAAIGGHAGNLEFYLNGLAAMGLLTKKDGKFRNSVLSETFLVDDRETYLGQYLQMTEQFSFQSKQQMKDAVLNGPPTPQENGGMDESFFASYTEAMRKAALSGTAKAAAAALANLPEFKGFKKMLDLGGAHGLDCIAAVQLHSSMTGTVFDQPPVVKYTQQIISDYGMDGRVDSVGGDFLVDDIPPGYDLIYMKGALNFTGPALAQVVGKIYTSLNDGGVFVAIHEGLTNEKTQPEGIVISWLPTALTSVDVSIEKSAVPDAMKAAGFTNIEIKPFNFFAGQIDMVVGRKK